jgi:hypothetical protein
MPVKKKKKKRSRRIGALAKGKRPAGSYSYIPTISGVKRRKAKRKKVVHKRATKKRSPSTVAHLLSRVKDKLNARLKDLLFLRDKATTRKQHKSAQRRITEIRKKLRKLL